MLSEDVANLIPFRMVTVATLYKNMKNMYKIVKYLRLKISKYKVISGICYKPFI